jgi:Reverse transcriptase (RNA-dependent DNA polymerase)
MKDYSLILRQALESVNSHKLIKSIDEEIKSMYNDKVWDIIPLPEGVKPIDYKWIFKNKKNSKGNMKRYKAWFVTKKITQKENINFMKTFSLVSTKNSFRIIMTLVTHFDLELY